MRSENRSELEFPAETYAAARQLFNIQHVYLRVGDALPEILEGIDLALLDPTSSLREETITRLALALCFQYAEYIPDTMACEASLRRMDWKYALRLPVSFPGISESMLCAFRERLSEQPRGLAVLGVLLGRLAELGLINQSDPVIEQPGDAVAQVCAINRFARARQALKFALGALIATDPGWIRTNASAHWFARYKTGTLTFPGPTELQEEAQILGGDILRLLQAVEKGPASLRDLAEIAALKYLFEDQYTASGDRVEWREPLCGTRRCG